MITLAGTVFRANTDARVGNAVVKFVSNAGVVKSILTDDDGDFSLDVDAGKWKLVALDEISRATSLDEADYQQNKAGLQLRMPRLADTVDEKAGRTFFGVLIGLLVALAAGYFVLHGVLVPSQDHVVSTTTLAEYASTLEAIDKDMRTDSTREDALKRLGQLRETLQTAQPKSYFWTQEPLRFVEVLAWGLAGVLVNLILTTSSYLRFQRFYREGIVMHIAQIVTVPFLAVVVVLLLSLVTLQVTITGNNQVKLDLADPRILAAVSFVISAQPWTIWKFVQDTGGKITSKVGG